MKDWQRIEAVLFGSGRYLTEEQIIQLSGVPKSKLKHALTELKNHYSHINSSLDIFRENDSWKLNVKEEFAHISKNVISEAEMSKPVMETLALIAYKSPVFQSEIIDMKGAGAYDYISLLEEKGFITKEKSGRTFKVKITPKFYDYFDISGDSKLRQMFKGVKKPDALGTLEVYTPENIEKKKDDEFSEKILERMKKVETTPFDHEEKKKFLEGFENKFSRTRTEIDETDREMNEFRKIVPQQTEGQEGEENKQEEGSANRPSEKKFNDPDRNTMRREESEEEREESDKREASSDSGENFSENALKKLEKALEGLDSPKSEEESEEEEKQEEEYSEDKETNEEKKPALPKKEIPEKKAEQSKVSPEKIQKIKEEEIKKINRKVQAKEEKKIGKKPHESSYKHKEEKKKK